MYQARSDSLFIEGGHSRDQEIELTRALLGLACSQARGSIHQYHFHSPSTYRMSWVRGVVESIMDCAEMMSSVYVLDRVLVVYLLCTDECLLYVATVVVVVVVVYSEVDC